MSGNVLITLFDTFLESNPSFIRMFQERGYNTIVRGDREPLSEEKLMPLIREADAYIVGLADVNRKVIESATRLKVIAAFGTGYNHIDTEAATQKGIVVANAQGVNAVSTAELTIGLMLDLARSVSSSDRCIRSGEWKSSVGSELHDKVLGIIGTGKIGYELARIAFHGFNMKILAHDVYQNENMIKECRAQYANIDTILENSDFVSVHIPLTEKTKGFISLKELKKMKKSAYLINAARGGIVDEDSLYEALVNQWIAGAALDVYTREPPVGSRMIGLDNIITTCHLGGSTRDAIERIGKVSYENVVNVLEGKKTEYCVNPKVYDSK